MAWVKDYRYGRNTGARGNPNSWRSAFKEVMDPDEAKQFLDDDSPWVILEIPVGSAFDVIKSAFRRLINIYHPDKWGNTKEANEKAKKIIAAWTLLKGDKRS